MRSPESDVASHDDMSGSKLQGYAVYAGLRRGHATARQAARIARQAGCSRVILGLPIKDVDMAVNLPSGGIRFASRYGWEIDADTFSGMCRNVDRLSIITRERVRAEFDRMLVCACPVMAMEMLRSTGAMFGYRLPLTGNDVMRIKGLQPGPQVKECMEYLQKLALVNPLRPVEEFEKHLKGYKLK